jgi:hypothetical protein
MNQNNPQDIFPPSNKKGMLTSVYTSTRERILHKMGRLDGQFVACLHRISIGLSVTHTNESPFFLFRSGRGGVGGAFDLMRNKTNKQTQKCQSRGQCRPHGKSLGHAPYRATVVWQRKESIYFVPTPPDTHTHT